MSAHDEKEATVNTAVEDDRMKTRDVRDYLGYRSSRTVYRLADPQDPRWNGHPPLSPGVRRAGGRDLWFLRQEVEEYRKSGSPKPEPRTME